MTIHQLLHQPIPPISRIPKRYFSISGWISLYGGWILWLISLHYDAFSFMGSKDTMGGLLYFGLCCFATVPGFILLFPYFLGLIASVIFVFVRQKPMGRAMRLYSFGMAECLFLAPSMMDQAASFTKQLIEYPGIPLFLLAHLMILAGIWLVPVHAKTCHTASELMG